MVEQEQGMLLQPPPRNHFSITGNTIVDGATLLALVTGYGYLMIYFYERGLCTYFGVPYSLIKVEPLKLVWIPAGIAFLYTAVNFMLYLLDPPLGRILSNRLWWQPLALFAYVLVYTATISWGAGSWVPLLTGLLFVVMWLCYPFVHSRKDLSYAERLSRLDILNANQDRLDVKLTVRVGRTLFLTFALISLTVILGKYVGMGMARHQSEFTIVASEGVAGAQRSEYLVLARYGDIFMTRQFEAPDSLGVNVKVFSIDELVNSGCVLRQVSIPKLLVGSAIVIGDPESNRQSEVDTTDSAPDSSSTSPLQASDATDAGER